MDPPPFAFKALNGAAKFDVNDIRGKLTIDGSSTFESVGDKVIVHNSGGSNDESLITNRQLPRTEVDGKDQNGKNIYKPSYDDEGDQITDEYISLEGFGFDIPYSGFKNPSGDDDTKIYGVLLKGIETIDLRMADEAPTGTPDASRNDQLTVSLLELRDSSGSSTRTGTFSDGKVKGSRKNKPSPLNFRSFWGMEMIMLS